MKKINRVEIPDIFVQYLSKHKPKDWDDLNTDMRSLLYSELRRMQKGLCAYTEIKLSEKNPSTIHIDHFYKRSLFKDKIFDFNNLFLAFSSDYFGAKYKDVIIRDRDNNLRLLKPDMIDPLDYFSYSATGKIIPKNENSDTQYTIETFNLNHKDLVSRRQDAIRIAYSYLGQDLTLEEIIDCIAEFPSAVRSVLAP